MGNGRFAKGHSGNPAGNPNLRRAAEMKNAAIATSTLEQHLSVLANIYKKATGKSKGAMGAAKLWWEIHFGKPKQQVEVSSDEDGDTDNVTLEQFLRAQRKIEREQSSSN